MEWLKFTRIDIAQFSYSPNTFTLTSAKTSETIILTEQSHAILMKLCLHTGIVVERDVLIRTVWGDNYSTGNKGLNNVIWQLRKAFETLINAELKGTPSKQSVESQQVTSIAICSTPPVIPPELQSEKHDDFFIRIPKKGYRLNACVQFNWIYELHHNAELTFVKQNAYVDEQLVQLNEPQKQLFSYIVNMSSPITTRGLCQALNIENYQLTTLLGELQQTLLSHNCSAQFIEKWNDKWLTVRSINNKETFKANTEKREQQSTPSQQKALNIAKNVSKFSTLKRLTNTPYVMGYLLVFAMLIIFAFDQNLFLSQNASHKVETAIDQYVTAHTEILMTLHNKQGGLSIIDVLNSHYAVLNSNHQANKFNDLDYVKALNHLSKLNIHYGAFDTSESLLEQALQLVEYKLNSTKNTDKILKQTNLLKAEIYISKSQHQAAQHLLNDLHYEKSSSIEWSLEEKLTVDVLQLRLHNQLGHFSQTAQRAEKLIKQHELLSGDIAIKENVSELLNYYAIALRQLNQLDKAIEIVHRLLELEIQQHDTQYNSSVERYSSLAVIYLFKGDIHQAITQFDNALSNNLRIYGEHSNNLPLLLNNASFAYFEDQQFEKALSAINKAITLQTKLFGKNHPKLGFLYLTKATHFFHLGNIEQANYFNRIALNLFEHKSNFEHPYRGRSFELAAHLFRVENDLINCASHIALARQLYAKSYPDKEHWVHQTVNISELMCLSNEKRIAKEQHQKLLNLAESVGEDSLPMRQIRHKLAQQPKRSL